MGACRESKPLEREFDRMMAHARSLDKLIWNYCGYNIETCEYPMNKFCNLKEDIEEFKDSFWKFMSAVRDEENLVKMIWEKKQPKIEVSSGPHHVCPFEQPESSL